MTDTTRSLKLLYVVGARPNFMKVAPIINEVKRRGDTIELPFGDVIAAAAAVPVTQILVHTGQHYDQKMSGVFFRDLGLPEPDYNLGVGSGSHTQQTAGVMTALEPVLTTEQPDLVLVAGDVNSTVAAALTAAKMNIPVAHIEAGLRSRDRAMPEEINRIVTDQLSDLLFTPSRDGDENLVAEGVAPEKIVFVGNTMIDSLEAHRADFKAASPLARLGLGPKGYVLVTLHRPSNVDDSASLKILMSALAQLADDITVVFPVHLRTQQSLERLLAEGGIERPPSLRLCEPLGYLEFLSLMNDARAVLTDSGGIQEETTVLGVPCCTLRTSTERPVTITEGTNRLVDPMDGQAILTAARAALRERSDGTRRPEYWDGQASARIIDAIADWFARS